MRTRVRFETDAGLMAEWLRNVGYPVDWSAEDLAARCVRLRAERGGDTAGYLWLHRADEHPDAMVLHACAAPEWRGRWVDNSVVARVFAVCELLGAKYLATEPTASAPKSLARFYRRLGFVEPRPGLYVATV